jgi:enamine deaminase RidA (YjgF/YER057c/UK114 family)
MGERMEIASGSPWEARYGYSRVVRAGSHVWVSGTTAMREGAVVGAGDMRAQTIRAFAIIEEALRQAGARLQDIVRVRIFTTDIGRADDIGQVMGTLFREFHPAATLVEVSKLINPDLLVEVEVDALVDA